MSLMSLLPWTLNLSITVWVSVLLWVSTGLCVCSRAKVIISARTGSMLLVLRGCWWCLAMLLRTSVEYWQEWAVPGFILQMRSQQLRRSAGIQTAPLSFLFSPQLSVQAAIVDQPNSFFTEPWIRLWWVNKNTLHGQTSWAEISSGKWCIVSILHNAAYSPFSLHYF